LQPVAIERGQLELQVVGGARHLLLKLAQHLVAVAFQKLHQLAHRLAILFAALRADARPAAELDVVVETGTRILARDLAVAVQIGKDAAQRVERLVAGAAAGVGAKIAVAVLEHPPHDLHFGEIFLPVDLDVGKVLSSLRRML
jgi:hypothetical protein